MSTEATTPAEQPAGPRREQRPCSRFSDTPETNAHLGSHANSPDDTAMWLEIGLPRRFERERNAALDALRKWKRLADAAAACNAEMERLEANPNLPHDLWHALELDHSILLADAESTRDEVLKEFSENVKEHATLSAGAHVDHGVEVGIGENHENRAADRGCCVSTCSPVFFHLG